MKSGSKKDDGTRLVYSSEVGSICPDCQKPEAACICAKKSREAIRGDGIVKVRRETKGRAGKTVSTITGLPLNQIELAQLLSELKRKCGAGGTVKDGVIEIQGDHVEVLVVELGKKKFSVR